MFTIKTKIKGETNKYIAKWHELKLSLINTYSDKRDIYKLNIEIINLKQNYNEIVFLNNVQQLLYLQITYIKTIAVTEGPLLISYFENYALRILFAD